MGTRLISKAYEVDPVFSQAVAAIYGDAVDPRELWDIAKSMPDGSGLHVNGAPSSRRKKAGLAAGLIAGTGIEALAAKETLGPLAHDLRAVRPVVGAAKGAGGKLRALAPLGPGKGRIGTGTKAGLMVGNLGVGIAAASELLKQPKKQAVAKSEESVETVWNGEISKVDSDKRQVFGWCSLSQVDGKDVIDLQGDHIPLDEIEKSAYHYVINSRKGGDMHRRVTKGLSTDYDEPLHTADLVESFVVTPEKLQKMGLPSDALPYGWWVGFKVNDDEQWNLVKSGKRTGFSIHGNGTRKDMH